MNYNEHSSVHGPFYLLRIQLNATPVDTHHMFPKATRSLKTVWKKVSRRAIGLRHAKCWWYIESTTRTKITYISKEYRIHILKPPYSLDYFTWTKDGSSTIPTKTNFQIKKEQKITAGIMLLKWIKSPLGSMTKRAPPNSRSIVRSNFTKLQC